MWLSFNTGLPKQNQDTKRVNDKFSIYGVIYNIHTLWQNIRHSLILPVQLTFLKC